MGKTRAKKAFDNMVENGGNISQAMIKAGYSKNTAKTPSKLTNTKTFQALTQKYLPDDVLLTKHRELLEVPRKMRTYIKGDLQTEIEELDSQAVGRGLDMAYKLKGAYAAEKHEITVPKPIMDVD